MLFYLIELILNYCCGSRRREEKTLLDRLKEDVKQLSEFEMNQLRLFIIKPLRDKTYCC